MNEPKIPRRASVIDVLASETRALHQDEIASRISVAPRHLPALARVIDDLVLDGTLTPLPGHRFKLAKEVRERSQSGADVMEGFFSANARGFGFVAALSGDGDVYIPHHAMGGALHGDRVRARIVARSSRGKEGVIEDVLTRRPALVAGTIRKRGRSAWIEPDDMRVRGPVVLTNLPENATEGLAAIARIVRFPVSPDENPEGVLVEVLGPVGVLDVEARKILATRGIDETFDTKAESEAIAFGVTVPLSMLDGREDLTHLPLPTIDPIDARDHDDAVWAQRNEDGSYRVWVAIADVSTYVTDGSALDASAVARGNSIYLPNRAIPMLPRLLSSDLCSLLPNEIRLCLAVEIDLDASGTTQGARVIDGFMRSAAKLTYEGVARALGLTSLPPRSEQAEAMREDLSVLSDVAGLLRRKRSRRGALAFDVPEAQILLDPATGAPIGVKKRGGDPGVAKAYGIIEELMILANETVADILVEHGAPAIFRDHAAPDPAKIERFGAMCERMGVPFDAEEALDPKKLSAFVKKMNENPRAALLQGLLVRSMKQATYDVANIGHFGLASKAYVHFTSPIRRYPDIVVHRTLRRVAKKQAIDKSEAAMSAMRNAAMQATVCERRGMEIERETADLYRAFFMKDHIGETFSATVTGLSMSGAFATIDDPFVDVMIRTDSMGADSYALDEDGLSMVATRSGDRIDLGDVVLLRVEEVSTERRTVYGRRILTADDEAAQSSTRADAKKKAKKKDAPVSARGRAQRNTPAAKTGRANSRHAAKEPSRKAKRAGGQRKRTK